MKQEFFTDTIQSSFIKNLLISTPLPVCNTVVTGDYVFSGNTYIMKSNVIYCTKTGYLGGKEEFDDNGNPYRTEYAGYETLSSYSLGAKVDKITNDFNSYFSYYDSDTHERLGKYLRCYRDLYNIDLMPFYNCFSGRYVEGIYVNNKTLYETNRTTDYKIFKVPVKFNKTYTIALDSDKDIYVYPVFLVNDNLLKAKVNGSVVDINLTKEYLSDKITYYNSMSFKAPKTFKIDNTGDNAELLNTYERDLYLLIQVGSTNNSSLVVLEGDYSTQWCTKVSNPEIIGSDSYPINKVCMSELSLLLFNDGNHYPFANRLIEFLLLNVISSRDEITENVERAQQYAGLSQNPDVDYTKLSVGVFTDELRKTFYDFAMGQDSVKHLDITGFIDKDVEKFLLKYKEVNNY